MLMQLKKQFKRGILLGFILLTLGISFSLAFNHYHDLNVQTITVINKSQNRIVGKVYTPKFAKLPLPVVILNHGISNSKEHSHLLGVEFARSGLAAIAFDFGGFGESYSLPKSKNVFEQLNISTQEDTQAIFDYIQANPQQFELDKIGIVGHSIVRLRDGLLTEALAMGNIVLFLLMRMILMPIFSIVLILRSRWFQHLEVNL